MARDKGQVLIYNSQELSLISNTFADNEELLYLIRKVLLQFPMTDIEKETVKNLVNPAVYSVIKKRLLPEIDADAPLTQLGDLYQSVNNDLKVKDPVGMAPLFAAKKIEIDYLTQQFRVLELMSLKADFEANGENAINLDSLKHIDLNDLEQTYINTTARNFLLSYVDSFLNLLKNLAGQKGETDEERLKRLTRDSSK